MKNVALRREYTMARRLRLRWTAVAVSLCLAGLAASPVLAASASTLRPAVSSGPCTATITAGSGAVVGSFIVGVTAGATQITFDCNVSASPAFAAEASMLGEVGSFSVSLASEADVAAVGIFASAPSDTGCPDGVAGACATTTFAVPASFSASDPKAVCPPTQAQVNAGLYGCALAVATAAKQPITGAAYLVTYASQTAPPTAPTIAATVSSGPPSSTITISDAAGHTAFWWGNAVQFNQAAAVGMAPQTTPSSCGSAGGFGDVPVSFLGVSWFAQGSVKAIAGDASAVTISNDCYDSNTLFTPVLSGTIPVPAALAVSTTYTAYLCELNITPFPSNDPNAAAHCGAAPAGANWIDAAFTFTAASGTPQAALTVTSLSGTAGTPLTLTTSGGSGAGSITYSVVDGTASGCSVSGGALSVQSAGTCYVTANKAGDSTYVGVSSIPTTVSLAAVLPVFSILTSKVKLASSAKTLPLRVSCAQASCSGTLSVGAVVKVASKNTTISMGSSVVHLSAGSSATISLHLSAAAVRYLKANPTRPPIVATASYTYTDSSGKHTKTGHVTLMK
jgi:hypothetical protein